MIKLKCPKCNYDMFGEYSDLINSGKETSKHIRISNINTTSTTDYLNGSDWDVKLTCPKCKTKWSFSDSDY